jgi:RNA polymerase sigma-70 factor, ECF subfamily
MDQSQFLAERPEANRAHLRSVAYRMLGSMSDADDAVQETWLRLSRADTSGVENLTAWLTTVVARVSLDMLRSRTSRREVQFGDSQPEPPASHEQRADPEHEAVLADSVGLALLVVLDTLAPAERLAFVLHDMFAVPFDEIASILGRSPVARADAFRGQRQTTTSRPTSRASERWSTHFWPRRAMATSTRCWRCLIRMSSCAPIAPS